MRSSYQDYIHEKLKKMSLMERVNAQSKQVQLVQRLNYNLNKMPPEVEHLIASEEALQSVTDKILEVRGDNPFQREELCEIIDHMPDASNKRRTGQEIMMAAMYGEEALPSKEDLLET